MAGVATGVTFVFSHHLSCRHSYHRSTDVLVEIDALVVAGEKLDSNLEVWHLDLSLCDPVDWSAWTSRSHAGRSVEMAECDLSVAITPPPFLVFSHYQGQRSLE